MITSILLSLLAQTSTLPGAQLDTQISDLQARVSAVETSRALVGPEGLASVSCSQLRCPVRIPPGEYVLTAPMLVNRGLDVDASGASFQCQNTTCLVIRGEHTVWRGGLFDTVTSTTVVPRPVGIMVQRAAAIRDVHQRRAVRGLMLACGTAGELADDVALGFDVEPDTNCNLFRIENSTFKENFLDGVYVVGQDANAGLGHVNSMVNCSRAVSFVGLPDYDDPASGGRCANLHERSKLGNTWIAPHSAHAIDKWTGADVRFFQYLGVEPGARNTMVGAYAETGASDGATGNGPSYLRGYGQTVLGGLNNTQVISGFRLSEWGQMNRAQFTTAEDESSLCLGQCDATGSVVSLGISSAPASHRLRLVPLADGRLELETRPASAGALGVLDMGASDPVWRGLSRTLLPACTSTTGVTWSSPSGLVVREDADGMSVCDGSE